MPVTDSYFVRGNVSLEKVCKLYSKLDKHIEQSRGFFHAKEHGVEEGYNAVRDEVQELIAKARQNNLEDISIFKETIKKLEEVYELE